MLTRARRHSVWITHLFGIRPGEYEDMDYEYLEGIVTATESWHANGGSWR